MTMEITFNQIEALLKQKINILIIDDNRSILDLLTKVLCSPLLSITTAASIENARTIIKTSDTRWHCWIIDIDLGKQRSGLTILEEFNYFQYTVIVSGLQNMHVAFKAAQMGVLQIYDKNPQILTRQFRENIYRIAALGFMLHGSRTDYLSVFLQLSNDVVLSPRLWAHRACVGLRQLEKICSLHMGITPRNAIPLYYFTNCLLYAQYNNDNLCLKEQQWKPHFDKKYYQFLEGIIQYHKKHFKTLFQCFSAG